MNLKDSYYAAADSLNELFMNLVLAIRDAEEEGLSRELIRRLHSSMHKLSLNMTNNFSEGSEIEELIKS